MKRIIPVFLVMVLILSACGTSKEVKSVIKSINSLSEITLESGAILNDIESAYNALSDEEKQQVSNFSTLEDAKKQYEVKCIIQSINSLSEITLESGTILDDIESAYNALRDEEKQQVSNLSTLKDARTQYEELYKEFERKQKNESIIEELDTKLNDLKNLKTSQKRDISSAITTIEQLYSSLDEDYKDQAKTYTKLDSYIAQCVKKSVNALTKNDNLNAGIILEEYKDYLNRTDIIQLLGEIGLQRCINDAIYNLNRINSGKVYSISGVNASCTDEMGHTTSYKAGENQVEGKISISGTNYFGGPYTQDINMFYTFNIDVENGYVNSVNGFTF